MSEKVSFLLVAREGDVDDADGAAGDVGQADYAGVDQLLALLAKLAGGFAVGGGIENQLARMRPLTAGILCLIMGAVIFLFWPTVDAPFIYFQF